jgi:hypothetical protein
VTKNLAQCRAAWWQTHGATGGLGLVNRSLEIRPASVGLLVRVTSRATASAVAIASAAYDPVVEKVRVVLADGRQLELSAGSHIEEAEEWS